MGIKGLVVFNSAVDQLRNSAKNIEAINMARSKHEQQRKTMETEQKLAEAQFENEKAKGTRTAMENQVLQIQLNEFKKQQKSILDGQGSMIDQAEQKETQKGKQAAVIAKTAYQRDPYVQMSVAAHVNPQMARVPGPQGGTVMGKVDDPGNTEAVNPNPLEPVYSGSRLARFGRKPYKSTTTQEKKPSHDEVLKLAREMAADDTSQVPLAEKIKKHLPQAKKIVYNEPEPEQGVKMDKVYRQDKPSGEAGKVVVIGPDGRQYKLPESQLAQAKKQGFKLAPAESDY